MTRGVLYYQFRNKTRLLRVVVEDLYLYTAQKVMSAMQSDQGEKGDLWDRVRRSTAAYLDACLGPGYPTYLGD